MSAKLNKIFSLIAVIAIITAGVAALAQPTDVYAASLEGKGGPGGQGAGGTGVGTGIPYSGTSLTPLSDAEISAIQQAILEEYGALNLYTSVANQLGYTYPFAQIAQSEQQHVNALVNLATKYRVNVIANPGLTNPPQFASTATACQAGVDAEIADAAFYDQLKPQVTHTDILQVFKNLQCASLNSHLPSFETCN